MDETKITSISDIKKQFGPLRDINEVHRNSLSPLERLAVFVTDKIGTMGFFFVIFGWTVVWLGWNVLAPIQYRFDPYPAFVLWLFISNLIQIHLMPLIMVGQNIQGRHAQLRTENDFTTDTKAEKEVEAILKHLENQEQLIKQLLEKINLLEKNNSTSSP